MAEEGQVIGNHTVESWKQQLENVKDSKKLHVAEEWSIEAMLTFLLLKEGNLVDKVVGAKKEELELTIAKHVPAAA